MYILNTKPRLVVLLGAGASVNLGIPSTEKVTESVFRSISEITIGNSGELWQQGSLCQPNLADLLHMILDQTYQKQLNFESYLHSLEAMAGLIRTWDEHTLPDFRIVEGVFTAGPRCDLLGCFNRYWIDEASVELQRCLHREFSFGNDQVAQQQSWNSIKGFFKQLETNFDLHVATLNYDLSIEQALDWGENDQGFELIPGETAWRFTCPPASIPKLMHLHGSICFGDRQSGSDPDRFLFEDESNDQYLHTSPNLAILSWRKKSHFNSQAGRTTIVGPFITGLQKPDKLLAEPYLSYFNKFGQLVSTTPRLLVIGYGFGDFHINAILRRLTKWHGSNRRAIIVDYLPESQWNMSSVWANKWLNLYRIAACWAEQSDALNVIDYPDPWLPTGIGADCLRVYFRGSQKQSTITEIA